MLGIGATVGQVEPTPPVSVWGAPDRYLLCVDLPGVPRSAVRLTVVDQTLVVIAERSVAVPSKGAELRWLEPALGLMQRQIWLPCDAAVEQIEARLRDGVLIVRIPRQTWWEVPQDIPVEALAPSQTRARLEDDASPKRPAPQSAAPSEPSIALRETSGDLPATATTAERSRLQAPGVLRHQTEPARKAEPSSPVQVERAKEEGARREEKPRAPELKGGRDAARRRRGKTPGSE